MAEGNWKKRDRGSNSRHSRKQRRQRKAARDRNCGYAGSRRGDIQRSIFDLKVGRL